jgi:glycosyltransferase involved in cell wall biosynthesis
MKDSYFFSVVTVCYNAADYIEDTVQSVINQTYTNFEFIIVDGASKDNTISILDQYKDHISLIISEPDNGIYDAMNKGIAAARGEWIIFMNAGDCFYSNNVLEKIASETLGDQAMIVGDTAVQMDHVIYKIPCSPFYEHLPLHQKMGWFHQSSFVRADLAKRYPFDLTFKLAADYNMVIELYRRGYSFKQVDIIIAKYDLNGVSYQKKRQHLLETLTIDYPEKRKFNILKSYLFYFLHVLRERVKPFIIKMSPSLTRTIRSHTKGRIIIN